MPSLSRRSALRLGVLGAALVGTTAGTKQLATSAPSPVDGDEHFSEVYKGRRIRGSADAGASHAGGRADGMTTSDAMSACEVYIDDRQLHVMTFDDGTYTSVMNHYQTFHTLRSTARAAVDNLRGAQLLTHS